MASMTLLRDPTEKEQQPLQDHEAAPDQVERATVSHHKRWGRFLLKKPTFTQQFSHIYNRRLQMLKMPLLEAAKARWKGVEICDRLVSVIEGEERVLIGTLFKRMEIRPSVLEEYKAERGISEKISVPEGNFSHDKDSLLLEDDSGRVALVGAALDIHTMVAGVVLAVKGVVLPDGTFQVTDWCPPGIAPQAEVGPEDEEKCPPEAQVLLVSGLLVGATHDDLPTKMLIDYVAGYLGGEGTESACNIAQVIVCGDSVAPMAEVISAPGAKGKATREAASKEVVAQRKEFDAALAQIAASCPVDVMPGSTDPSDYMLPQQPMHKLLLPVASAFSTTRRTTNPYEAIIGGRTFLGNSGQPLHNMQQYTRYGEEDGAKGTGEPWQLEVLAKTLEWRHQAPTAPGTLGCHPFAKEDPFVITECPHVYFAGNQDEYATKEVNGVDGQQVRVICVPSFAKTGQGVLVNIKTLQSMPISFLAELDPEEPRPQAGGTADDLTA
ncbi:unnamed protein product [Chrysoparadoxa australica]